MKISIALFGSDKSELIEAMNQIRALSEGQLYPFNIRYFLNKDHLVESILDFDIVVISETLFNNELLTIQQAIIERSKTKVDKKRIVLTNLKLPVEKNTIHNWIKQLEKNHPNLNIPIENGIKQENVQDILYFEYFNRKVYVKTQNDYYLTKLKMSDVRKKLADLNYFETPYVSYVVNLNWIETIKSRDILMKNGDILPLSQKKAHRFRQVYKEFLSSLS